MSRDAALVKAMREWNYAGKLKASGFQDLEVGTGETLSHRGVLLIGEDVEAHVIRGEQLANIEDASQELLRRKVWPSPFHRQVWELHCQGLNIHKIRDALHCGIQRALDAYAWCCEQAGIPTGGYRGGKGERRDGRERRRKSVRPARIAKKLGLRELLTVVEHVRTAHE